MILPQVYPWIKTPFPLLLVCQVWKETIHCIPAFQWKQFMWALQNHYYDISKKILLSKSFENEMGRDVFLACVRYGDLEGTEISLPYIETPSLNENEAFRFACRRGYFNIVSFLSKYPKVHANNRNNEALRWAIENQHYNIVHLVLNLKSTVISIDILGCIDPLIEKKDWKMIRLLVEHQKLHILRVKRYRGLEHVDGVNIDLYLLYGKDKDRFVQTLSICNPIYYSRIKYYIVQSIKYNRSLKSEVQLYLSTDSKDLNRFRHILWQAIKYKNFDIIDTVIDHKNFQSTCLSQALFKAASLSSSYYPASFLHLLSKLQPFYSSCFLHRCIDDGNLDVIKIFLQFKRNLFSLQTFIIPVSNNDGEILKFLLHHIPELDPSLQHNKLLRIARELNHEEIINILISDKRIVQKHINSPRIGNRK